MRCSIYLRIRTSRGGAQPDDPVLGLGLVEELHDAHVAVLPRGLVGLVQHQQHDVGGVQHRAAAQPLLQVVVDGLGRSKDDALRGPQFLSLEGGHLSRQDGRLVRVHQVLPHLSARLDLLVDERQRRGAEHHGSRRKPQMVVVQHGRGDQGLAQPGGQAHERVEEQARFRHLDLVLSRLELVAGGVVPVLRRVLVQGDVPHPVREAAGQ
jgi:hypothetical protein